jgi:polyisoprenoid-binding protein YceI
MKQRYQVDRNHSRLGFSAKHLGVSTVRGQFAKFDGWLEGDLDDVKSVKGEGTVEVASIDTGVEMRDNHLRSADFFEAEKYPQISFQLASVEPVEGEGDTYLVTGDLTIKDTTKPVTFEATLDGRIPDPFGGVERVGVTATGQINRMDYGLNWDGLAGAIPVAGHTIRFELDLALVVPAAEMAKAS